FYAPWCGYCRQFEATYADAARALASAEPNLIVARIDGTRYPVETSSAGVRGYPTVLLFKDGKSYTFAGERTVEGVLVFVQSVLGPAVETLDDEKALEKKIEQHFDEVFFLYCGSQEGRLWDVFNDTAGEFRLQLPFYRVVRIGCDGEIFVYKDGSRKQFLPIAVISNIGDLQSQLSAFVEENRHPAFGQMSVYEIRQMASDSAFENTSICILLIDPFSESSRVLVWRILTCNYSHTPIFRPHQHGFHVHQVECEIGRELAIVDSTPTLKRFKFVWTVDERGLSSLAMTTLEAPNILIYMPGNESLILYTHHNLADTTVGISKQNFISFLEDAANGQIPVSIHPAYGIKQCKFGSALTGHYGGRSWLTTVRRFVFDFCVGSLVGPYSPRVPSTVYDASVLHIGCFPPFSFENFFRTSPILALLTFGVPLGCLSCLAYCICCSPFDTMDDSSFDDDDVDAAALEARRARLLDRSVLDAKLGPTTYYDAVRARSIYKRLAGEFVTKDVS
ncbi:unnamed protein product, partial [Mesocestoides corti]